MRLIDSINRPKDLILKAYELGLSGIALTDHECVSGAVDFLNAEKELKEKKKIPEDFKCILGNEVYLTDTREPKQKYFHHILIAKDTIGFRQLRELSSTAWINMYNYRGMDRVPLLRRELEEKVKENPGHLVSTSACIGGRLGFLVFTIRDEKDEEKIYELKKEIVDFIDWNKELFGDDFYIEVAPGTSKDQVYFNKFIKNVASACHCKIIMATDAHYLTAEDRTVHKGYLNSKEGEREVDSFYFDSHLMDNEEAFSNFQKSGYTEEDFKTLCASTMEVYYKVVGYDIFHKPIIPEVEVKDYPKTLSYFEGVSDDKYPVLKELLLSNNIQERYWVNECLRSLIAKNLFCDEYLDRVNTEANVIKVISTKLENCLFAYFNTFQHFIDIFWSCGSIVGPGRGSSVCFLSNYLLGITQLDPIREGLAMWWRFLNEERLELPDIDIDLSPSKRPKIFEAIRKERGEYNVLQVATFGTEGTRSAINAAARSLGIDTDVAQYLTSLIPQNRGFLPSLHEVIYGDEEKGTKPIQQFIDEANKYDGFLEIAMGIEGLICRRGTHASGVMIYNNSPYETNAIMRSPDGTLTTQFDLHQSEALGDTKFDYLVTEITDKLEECLRLLQNDGYFPSEKTLKELYDENIHPSVIDLSNKKIWDALGKAEIMDIFQFSTAVGISTARATKPNNPFDMAIANALIRLSGDKGQERPADRYVRLKADMSKWYEECKDWGLSEEEIKILEPYYLPTYGCPCSQEHLMLVCMDKNIANFSLADANTARKICAKKKIDRVEWLHQKFIDACKDNGHKNLGEYVWETTMRPQMSYAFALPHGLAYSYVGIQTLYLATEYPQIYWDTACLIVNSGGNASIDNEEDESDNEEDEFDDDSDEVCEKEEEDSATTKKKKKVKNTDYGKIATALGNIQTMGTVVVAPSVNKSDFTFKPDSANNVIIYGLRGISRIGVNIIKEIMKNRPYTSFQDFESKVKVNKIQMINLIKAGAFDEFGDRVQIMRRYINEISDTKKRITLQNMKMLIDFGLIPDKFDLQKRVFNFNKYIKKMKLDGTYYGLDNIALAFFDKNFCIDNLVPTDETESGFKIKQTTWDSIYKKQMDTIRPWVKNNNAELLEKVNNRLTADTWNKYCIGTISKWEMDSINCYINPHEIDSSMEHRIAGFSRWDLLDKEPQIDIVIRSKAGEPIPLYKISRIVGTVIDKDKNKRTVTLLTPHGVAAVKLFGPMFANYDRQISERGADGKKHVIERSWFQRGNKIIVSGIRREDNFIAKKYSRTPWNLVELVTGVNEDGTVVTRGERMEVNE